MSFSTFYSRFNKQFPQDKDFFLIWWLIIMGCQANEKKHSELLTFNGLLENNFTRANWGNVFFWMQILISLLKFLAWFINSLELGDKYCITQNFRFLDPKSPCNGIFAGFFLYFWIIEIFFLVKQDIVTRFLTSKFKCKFNLQVTFYLFK